MKSIFSNQMVPIFVAWLAAVSALFLPVETATLKGASGFLWVAWFLPAQATDLMSDVFTLRIDNFLLGLWFGTIELFCVIALLYPLIFWLVAKRGKRRPTMTLFYFTGGGAVVSFAIQLVTGPLFSIGFIAYMFSLVANAAICLVFAARQATTSHNGGKMKFNFPFAFFLPALFVMCGWFDSSGTPVSWERVYPGAALYDVYFSSPDTGISIGEFGTILHTNDGGKTWVPVQSGTKQTLRKLHFWDPGKGMAVGDSGTVLRTEDGGSHWSRQNISRSEDLKDVFFLNGKDGVIAGGTSNTVLMTDDSGATWHDNMVPPPSQSSFSRVYMEKGRRTKVLISYFCELRELNDDYTLLPLSTFQASMSSVSFVNSDTVFLGTAERGLYCTKNGGKSWDTLQQNGKGSFNELFFVNSQAGYGAVREGNTSTLLRTTTRGTVWDTLWRDSALLISSLSFFSNVPRLGLFFDKINTTALRRTTDGGHTWTTVYSSSPLTKAAFFDEQTAVAIGPAGTIVRTLDGGITWNSVQSGTKVYLSGITILDNRNAVVVGFSGTILQSADAGRTWTQSRTDTTKYLSDVSFSGKDTGMVVGSNGEILLTCDGAGSWKRISGWTIPNTRVNTTWFQSADTGLVGGWRQESGYWGAILRTIDKGKTWQEVWNGGNYSDIRSMKFISKDTGIAVGTYGVVLTTINGGVTWNSTASPADNYQDLTNLEYIPEDHLLVSTGNKIYSSNNAGATWTNFPVSSANTYRGFVRRGPSAYTAVGDGKVIATSINKGTTWSLQNGDSIIGGEVYGISFMNADSGVAVGRSGTMLRSVDGGMNWHPVHSATGSSLMGVAFSPSGFGKAIGDQEISTRDGGVTWTAGPYLGGWTGNTILRDICYVKDNTFIAVGGPHVVKTTNGWINSNPVAAALGDTILCAVDVNSSGSGYAVGYQGMIIKTSDTGNTWKRIPCATQGQFMDVHAFSNGNAVFGNNLGMFATLDSGKTVVQLPEADVIKANFTNFAFLDSQRAVGGNAIYTNDGGITWNSCGWGTTCLENPWRVGSVFFSPENGSIYKVFNNSSEIYRTSPDGYFTNALTRTQNTDAVRPMIAPNRIVRISASALSNRIRIYFKTPLTRDRLTRDIAVCVYNLNGRLVSTLEDGQETGDVYTACWGRKASRGTKIIPGTYVLTFKTGSQRFAKNFLIAY
jgi:photosystem II stability/assembly factor-like uncharacterized protein